MFAKNKLGYLKSLLKLFLHLWNSYKEDEDEDT